MTYRTRLQEIAPVTHDTWRLVLSRPEGYAFEPGQSCLWTLDRDGLRDESRPFSFTSLPDADHLEFIVKSYPERGGVTAEIPRLEPGETVTIGAPLGTIRDSGPGIFLAGGAGITPFVPILRRRARDDDQITACTLIYCNKTEADIILREEWEAMSGLSTIFMVTQQDDTTLRKCRLDASFIEETVKGFRDTFYVCGPPGMVRTVCAALRERSVPEEKIVTERD